MFIVLRLSDGKYLLFGGFKYISAVIARTRTKNIIEQLTIYGRVIVCAPAMHLSGKCVT